MKTQGNRTQIRLQFRNQTPDHLCRGFSFFFLHRFTSRHSPNSLLYERTGFLALPYQNWHLTWPQTKDCDALTPLLFPKRSSYYSLGIISLGLPHTHLMAEALSLNPLPPLRQSSDPFNYNQCFFFFFPHHIFRHQELPSCSIPAWNSHFDSAQILSHQEKMSEGLEMSKKVSWMSFPLNTKYSLPGASQMAQW